MPERFEARGLVVEVLPLDAERDVVDGRPVDEPLKELRCQSPAAARLFRRLLAVAALAMPVGRRRAVGGLVRRLRNQEQDGQSACFRYVVGVSSSWSQCRQVWYWSTSMVVTPPLTAASIYTFQKGTILPVFRLAESGRGEQPFIGCSVYPANAP